MLTLRRFLLLLLAVSLPLFPFAQKKPKKDKKKKEVPENTIKPGGLLEIDANLNNPVQDPETAKKVSFLFVEACTQHLTGNIKEAAGLFKQVTEIQPTNHAAWYNLALIGIESGDFEFAKTASTRALSLNPDIYWYYRTMADVYLKLLDVPNAQKALEACIKRFPDRVEERYELVQIYGENGKYPQALEQLDAMEKLIGPSEEISIDRCQVYTLQKNYDLAREEMLKLIGMNPYEVKYYELLYQQYLTEGKETEALGVLDNLLKVSPGNDYALLTLADHYRKLGDMKKSDEYLFKAFEQNGVSADGKFKIIENLLAASMQDASQLERVGVLTGKMCIQFPKEARSWALRGDYFSVSAKLDSALVYYRHSLEIQPQQEGVWQQLLLVYSDKGDTKGMYSEAEKALEYYPNSELILYMYGAGAFVSQKTDEALYAFEKLKKMKIQNPEMKLDVYSYLGDIYQSKKRFAESDAMYEEALKIDPKNEHVLNNYAYYLSLRKERLEDAEKMILSALKLHPESSTYLDTYGWILFQQGKYSQAYEQLFKAAALKTDAEIMEHLGDTCFKLGKQPEATQYWKKAIELGATFTIEEKTKNLTTP